MAEINKDLWNLLSDGRVQSYNVMGYGVTQTTTGHIILRIDYATSQSHIDKIVDGKAKPERLQVSLLPSTSIKLALLLLKAAQDLGGDPATDVH